MDAVRIFEITGYQGSKAALEHFFVRVIDKEGAVAHGGLRELREWLKASSPSVQLKHWDGRSPFVAGGVGMPVDGKAYEMGPNIYRLYFTKRGNVSTRVGTTIGTAPPDRDNFYKNDAYKMCVALFLPEVEFYTGGFTEPAIDLILPRLALTQPAQDFLPDVTIDKYVKKPYPGAFFAELEEQRKDLDELAVVAAQLTIEEDKAAARKLIEDIHNKSRKMRTDAAKAAYAALADRLAVKLNLNKK